MPESTTMKWRSRSALRTIAPIASSVSSTDSFSATAAPTVSTTSAITTMNCRSACLPTSCTSFSVACEATAASTNEPASR